MKKENLLITVLLIFTIGAIAVYFFIFKKPTVATNGTPGKTGTDKTPGDGWVDYVVSDNESVNYENRKMGMISIDDICAYFGITKAQFIEYNDDLKGVDTVEYGTVVSVPIPA